MLREEIWGNLYNQQNPERNSTLINGMYCIADWDYVDDIGT